MLLPRLVPRRAREPKFLPRLLVLNLVLLAHDGALFVPRSCSLPLLPLCITATASTAATASASFPAFQAHGQPAFVSDGQHRGILRVSRVRSAAVAVVTLSHQQLHTRPHIRRLAPLKRTGHVGRLRSIRVRVEHRGRTPTLLALQRTETFASARLGVLLEEVGLAVFAAAALLAVRAYTPQSLLFLVLRAHRPSPSALTHRAEQGQPPALIVLVQPRTCRVQGGAQCGDTRLQRQPGLAVADRPIDTRTKRRTHAIQVRERSA